MVCLGNICVNTLHKGDTDDDDGDITTTTTIIIIIITGTTPVPKCI
jgi:hypothetical protein